MRDKQAHADRQRHANQAKILWVNKNGPIPRDENGKPYQIHHKDKNWRNNSLENLQCVSRKEHEEIHLQDRIAVATKSQKHFVPGNTFGKMNAGKIRSKEAKEKIADFRRGSKSSEDTKRKISLANIGKNKGRKKSPEEIARREATKAAKRMARLCDNEATRD